MKTEDVIIVGAGPAGLATAIQLKRYGIHPLLFERVRVGGLLHNANLVENYPGFPHGISGPRLVNLFARQAQRLNIAVIYEEVVELVYDQGVFHAKTSQTSYASRCVVIATGTKPLRFLNLPIPEDLSDRVFYEVFDLLQAEGKHIVVVGSGDAAFDYALNLSRNNRTTLKSIRKDLPDGILLDCQGPAGALQFHADYLVGAIGREARLDCLSDAFLQQAQALEEQGLLYMIGDVKNGLYRQTSIAVGQGVMAAMKIYRYMKETA